MNVVNLLDRIVANKTKLAEEQEALESNYEPDVKDVRTFLMVLRHLQKRSGNEMASIKLDTDFLEFKVTELVGVDSDDDISFMNCSERTRTVTFNFPWNLLDFDESEYSRDLNGEDSVDKFSAVVLNWVNTISAVS